MRRIILMAIASSALALAAPTVASAHRGHHHARHHARKARVRHFGTLASSTTAPSTSSPSAPSPAGTVKTFNEGVLTITLADGSTVSGKVTEDTEIECVKAGTEAPGDDDQGADDGHAVMADDHGDQGDDDQGEGAGDGTTCTSAALVPTAVVLGAELRLGASGAVWKQIVVSA
jgi:hypothetical protein